MSELPSTYQSDCRKIYYVYFHIDPESSEVVYVGKGSRGRAWHCAESNSRGEDHALWMNGLIQEGFTPDAWVKIVESSLEEAEAFQLEKEEVDTRRPKFNSKKDGACKLTSFDLEEIKFWRDRGLSYEKIADKIGSSTMTVFRAYNGKTKNYVF